MILVDPPSVSTRAPPCKNEELERERARNIVPREYRLADCGRLERLPSHHGTTQGDIIMVFVHFLYVRNTGTQRKRLAASLASYGGMGSSAIFATAKEMMRYVFLIVELANYKLSRRNRSSKLPTQWIQPETGGRARTALHVGQFVQCMADADVIGTAPIIDFSDEAKSSRRAAGEQLCDRITASTEAFFQWYTLDKLMAYRVRLVG